MFIRASRGDRTKVQKNLHYNQLYKPFHKMGFSFAVANSEGLIEIVHLHVVLREPLLLAHSKYLRLYPLGNFSFFFCPLLFFSKSAFSKNYFKNTI